MESSDTGTLGRHAGSWLAVILAVWATAGCAPERRPARFPERPAAAPGETVFCSETARIKGFDPVKAGDVASAHAVSRIYEGLLQYAYLARPYRLEPCLAEALPEVSADGLEYTFHVRRGIYFQDDPCFRATGGRGRELTAEDFVYAIKRVADIKNGSPGYWAFRDRIPGLDEFRAASAGAEPTDYDRPVTGLQAPDRYTLRIRLKGPYPQLLWVLAMNYAFAVPREAVEYYGEDFVNHPVGTGPYILAGHIHNYRVEFVRNPKWRETGRRDTYPTEGEPGDAERGLLVDAGQPIPFIDRIVQYVIGDSTTRWLLFLAGQLDVAGISKDNWDAVVTPAGTLVPELQARGIIMESMPELSTYYLGFNMEDPVVGGNPGQGDADAIERRRKLRQALTCAVDSEQWIKFYNGRVVRALGPLPPGVSGHETQESPFGYDPEHAAALLREAGYPEGRDPATGRRLELWLELGSAETETRELAEVLGEFFDRIGVVLRPSFNNWPTFLTKVEQRRAQLFLMGWVADYPDAQNFLQLFYGPNASPGVNHANYRNPEFDRLYERLAVLSEGPEKQELCRQMTALVIRDCPWLFLHHPKAYGLRYRRLRNYKLHDFPYGMIKYQRLEAEPRAMDQSGAAAMRGDRAR